MCAALIPVFPTVKAGSVKDGTAYVVLLVAALEAADKVSVDIALTDTVPADAELVFRSKIWLPAATEPDLDAVYPDADMD